MRPGVYELRIYNKILLENYHTLKSPYVSSVTSCLTHIKYTLYFYVYKCLTSFVCVYVNMGSMGIKECMY